MELFLESIPGILLSAFNARPLWNTSILGPLFLASGLSSGVAATLILSKNPTERKQFARIDLVLIGIELFLIIHMFMGFLASTQVQIDAVNMFLGGPYTMSFWIFVVILGMLIPALLEFMELGKFLLTGNCSGCTGDLWQPDVAFYYCICRTGKPLVILDIWN